MHICFVFLHLFLCSSFLVATQNFLYWIISPFQLEYKFNFSDLTFKWIMCCDISQNRIKIMNMSHAYSSVSMWALHTFADLCTVNICWLVKINSSYGINPFKQLADVQFLFSCFLILIVIVRIKRHLIYHNTALTVIHTWFPHVSRAVLSFVLFLTSIISGSQMWRCSFCGNMQENNIFSHLIF